MQGLSCSRQIPEICPGPPCGADANDGMLLASELQSTVSDFWHCCRTLKTQSQELLSYWHAPTCGTDVGVPDPALRQLAKRKKDPVHSPVFSRWNLQIPSPKQTTLCAASKTTNSPKQGSSFMQHVSYTPQQKAASFSGIRMFLLKQMLPSRGILPVFKGARSPPRRELCAALGFRTPESRAWRHRYRKALSA